MKRWLKNPQQSERYSCSIKSLERMRKDGRLPPSKYPFGNGIPANTEEELDAHDAAVVRTGGPKRPRGVAVRQDVPSRGSESTT
jgi:hypothetical protein